METYTLITGAASGFGRAIALKLAPTRKLILADMNGERLETVRLACASPEKHLTWIRDLSQLPGIGDDLAAMLAARETFIRTLLDSLLSSSQKYAADNRDLVKLVLDSHRQVTSELQELHKMVRESTLRREDADITRMTIELERIRLQGEQKEQEFQHMLKLDQNERGMNALEALISNPLAKSAPMPKQIAVWHGYSCGCSLCSTLRDTADRMARRPNITVNMLEPVVRPFFREAKKRMECKA